MPKIEELQNQEGEVYAYAFYCKGCGHHHSFHKEKWWFNGDFDRPTFTPSLLVKYKERLSQEQYDRIMKGEDVSHELRNMVCHSFVTDGKIRYLGDCTHDYKNKTIELEEVE